METRSRTLLSLKNVYFSLFAQFLNIVLNYVCRYFFVKNLASEYLGVNGLFSNILTIFSLAELGIGSAIVFAMYKPIAEKNTLKIQQYMQFYKKCYTIIALVIFIIGISLLPNIDFFINGDSNIGNLELIYFLYLIDSVSSYLFIYKASILNAMQENYICNIYQSIGKFVMSLLLIISLILFKNFIVYLCIQILFKFLINFLISKKADQKYPYIKEKSKNELEEEEKKNIFKNVYALFCNQIGNVIILGTDNIIISKYIGLVATGLYSNYYLVTSSLTNIIGQIFNSIVASVGNMAVEKDKEYTYNMFNRIYFLNFILSIFCTTILSVCINPFIEWSFGKEYLLDNITCIIILLNFYLLVIKNVVGTFKYALGIFWDDKYCTFIRAIINLIVSILLVKPCGISGIFIGTLVSDLLTTFWFQPYVLYKNGFEKNAKFYFIDFMKYAFCTIFTIIISFVIIKYISIPNLFIQLIFNLFISAFVVLGVIILIFRKNNNYQYLKDFIKQIISKCISKIHSNK